MFEADDPRHGTYAGYTQHKRWRVPPCDACRNAGTEYQRARRAKNPTAREADRAQDRVMAEARRRLINLYPTVYSALLAEVRAEMRQDPNISTD